MKIGIVGPTGSGKTCYFYGMLHKMQRGISGFSLRVDDETYWKLRKEFISLGDVRLPMDERWPDSSDKMEKYHLDLLYNLNKWDSLEWVDYPGEHVSEAHDDFINLLDGATCLIVCVDGSLLQGDAEDLEDIADDFYHGFGIDFCNALMRAEQKSGEELPPVCILITKYDAVSPELQNMDLITKFVKSCFPVLFCEENGKDRIVTICPVSLGKDIAEGGKLRLRNVHLPLFAAWYFRLRKLHQQAYDMLHKFDRLPYIIRQHRSQVYQEMVVLYEEMVQQTSDLENDLMLLPLFVNGRECTWEK